MIKNRTQVFSGQIIASMISLILPWRYVLFGGISCLVDKYNLIIQYLLFFIILTFTLSYILILVNKKKLFLKEKINKNLKKLN